MNTFTYQIGNNLYINLTNRCSNRCTFCVRDQSAQYEGYSLWLDSEPSVEDVVKEIGDPAQYEEIVFPVLPAVLLHYHPFVLQHCDEFDQLVVA